LTISAVNQTMLKLINYIPLKWLEKMIRFGRKQKEYKGNYSCSGTVSNVGKLPIEIMHGGGFKAHAAWGLPTALENLPVFFSLIGAEDYSEMVIAMPKVLASNGRLEEFIANIQAGVKPL
jgi:hypothetical protein